MLYLGTSGFSYNDWVGPFYPPSLPKGDWLTFYAGEFNTCEINSTFYAIPAPAMIQGLMKKVGKDFMFVLKANQAMSHQQAGNQDAFRSFREAIEPMTASGKLGCVLYQFPYSFGCNRANMDYLKVVRERSGELPAVIEFRNAAWIREVVFDLLRANGLGFCCVDEPHLPGLMPPVARATSRTGYVRFHGRNGPKWWEHAESYERYDYTYRREELAEWLPRIKALEQATENTFIFGNNHWRGQSVDTIRQLKLMLD